LSPDTCDNIIKLCRGHQKPYKIMRMDTFAVQDKVNLDIKNARGLNLAMVKLKSAEMTNLPF
jgi:hypothetical protein